MNRRIIAGLMTATITLAGCGATAARPATASASPPRPLQTSADVEWTGPGSDHHQCGAFAVTFTFTAMDAKTRSRVSGQPLTIQLNTQVGKNPAAALAPGGPLDGIRSTERFNGQGVASFTFTTELRKGSGFVRWSAVPVHPPVNAPAVAAGRQC
jgi:hypothetical protein